MAKLRALVLTAVAIVVAFVATTGVSPSAATKKPVGTVAIYRVYVDGPRDVQRLVNGGYDLVEARGDDYLLVVGNPSTAKRLRGQGFTVKIDKRLDPVAPLDRRARALTTFYGGYRSVDQHDAHLAAVATDYPALATLVDYGDSWRKVQGRTDGNDLFAICLTAKQPGDCTLSPTSTKPRAMIMAAIHARELQTSEIAWRLVDDLVQKYGTDPDITMLMDTTETWIIPVVNPDGREIVETGGNSPYLQRKNANNSVGTCSVPPTASNHHGVDLNRNASFGWGGVGTSTDPCAQTYKGTVPASEPEQQALQTLFGQLWPDQKGPARTDAVAPTARGTFVSLHSYGNLVLLPPGDGGTTPNDASLRSLAFRMSRFNGYTTGTGPEILYGTTGTTDDYTYGTLGVASFTFEVSPTSGTCSGFTPAYSCIDSTLYPLNRDALLYLVRVAGSPYTTPFGPTITTVASPTVRPGTPAVVTATADDNAYGSAAGSVGRPAAQTVAAAEYYLDTPPWAGGTPVAMTAGDGSFNTATETVTASIPTTSLTNGRHTVFVRSLDASGNWGPFRATSFTIDPNAPLTLFSDNFQAGSGNWSALSGSATWSLVTDGTQRYRGSASNSTVTGERVAGQTTWTNYSVQATTKTTTKRATNRGPGILARVQSASNHYRFAYTSSGTWSIVRVSNGTATTLAQSAATTLSTGTTYVLRAEVNGSQLRFFVNGTLVASATDTTFSSGRIGLRVYGSVSTFDDVVVDPL